MSIRLSAKHGVNPHLTYCPRCGGETNELILTGAASLWECSSCKATSVGSPPRGQCHKCGRYTMSRSRELTPEDRLPASQPCDACQKELAEFDKELKKGGVKFRCKDCQSEGVILAHHPTAEWMRKNHPGCGVELTKEECPRCRGEMDATK